MIVLPCRKRWRMVSEPTGVGLLDPVTSFLADHNRRTESMLFAEVFDAYNARPGRSEDYLASLRQTRTKISGLLDRPVCDLTADDFERALSDCTVSVRNLRALVRKRAENHRRAGVKPVKDGLRHGYCSAWLATHGDLNRLLIQSGHSNAKTIWEHYYRAMSVEEAEQYWSIRP